MKIRFNPPANDDSALLNSPILRAAQLTMKYVEENGSIELTKSKTLNSQFVKWAIVYFEWPYFSSDILINNSRELDEVDFIPLRVLHGILTSAKIGKHHKGAFQFTKEGIELKDKPSQLWAILSRFLLFNTDYTQATRTGDFCIGSWDIFLNFINIGAQQAITTKEICDILYPEYRDSEYAIIQYSNFYASILRPLCWAGLLIEIRADICDASDCAFIKTALWKSTLSLDTDDKLRTFATN